MYFAEFLDKGVPPRTEILGGFFTFMKNYIINKVHEHELDLRKSLLEKYLQADADAGGAFEFNTITGTRSSFTEIHYITHC